jgi:7tm Chemosensory receptor
MFSLSASDFYDIFAPLHFCSKLIGLSAFTIEKRKNVFEISTTLADLTWITIMTFVNLTIGIWMAISLKEIEILRNSYLYSNVLYRAFMAMTFAFGFTSTISCWWIWAKRRLFANILNYIAEIDDRLSRLGVAVDLRLHKQFTLLFMLSTKFLMFFGFFVSYTISVLNLSVSYKFNIVSCLIIAFLLDLSFTMFLHFTFFMWSVKVRYSRINALLFMGLQCSTHDDIKIGKEVLREVASLHDKLVDVSETINRAYGVPVSNLRLHLSSFPIIHFIVLLT